VPAGDAAGKEFQGFKVEKAFGTGRGYPQFYCGNLVKKYRPLPPARTLQFPVFYTPPLRPVAAEDLFSPGGTVQKTPDLFGKGNASGQEDGEKGKKEYPSVFHAQ
jgi:hypothetical protein